MFWNKISGLYDFIEKTYNGKANRDAVNIVSSLVGSNDNVLECACGTGMFSVGIARKADHLTATDYASKMLARAERKCRRSGFDNCEFEFADICNLSYEDDSYDKVVAANVIHLLDDPAKAMEEFRRIVKPGGEIIIPTYVNKSCKSASRAAEFFNKCGANFKRQFDVESYKKFFEDLGYSDVEYHVAEGRMPCDVAVIRV